MKKAYTISIILILIFFEKAELFSSSTFDLSYNQIRPKIALVLSGGGSRGISQIGVLKEFENAGIQIDYIVGTSIGAILGGLYSTGYSADELDSIVSKADWNTVFSLLSESPRGDFFFDQKQISDRSLFTIRFDNFNLVVPEAITTGSNFSVFLQKFIWNGIYHADDDFNKLKYPFRAVTTDIGAGVTVSMKSGSLVTAMRASSTIPIRNTPIRVDSMIYVDGGVLANIPVDQAKEFNPDIIIVVDATSPMMNRKELDKPWNLADQVVSLLMNHFSKDAEKRADFIIRPDLSGIKNNDFSNPREIINRGKTAAKNSLPELQQVINQKQDLVLKKFIADNHLKNRCIVNGLTLSDMNKSGSSSDFSSSVISFLKNQKETINEIKIEINSSDSISEIIINKDEYPRINDIILISSDISFKGRLLNYLLEKFKGKFLSDKIKREIQEEILRFYNKEGFSFTTIKDVFFDKQKGELTVEINEVRINSIKIKGNKNTLDYLISRECNFKENDPVNADDIIRAWENLMSTGLFYDVDIMISQAKNLKGLDVLVNVKEMASQSISVSGRIDNERYTQGNLDLIQENLLNTGGRLNANMSGGVRNFSGSLNLNYPRILSSTATAEILGYYKKKDIFNYVPLENLERNRFENIRKGEYYEERYGGLGNIGLLIEKKGILSVGFRFERFRSWKLGDTIKEKIQTLQTVKIGAIFDTENRTEFPTSGTFFSISLETSMLQDPSITGFSKAEFNFRTNYTLGWYTLKPSVYFGFADASLPSTERFNMGGQESFFGLREEEYRGRQIAKGSLEYRLRMPFKLYFDTFFMLRYDIGGIWEKVETIKWESLSHGVGIGFFVDTPVGPAKFSLGRAFYFLKNPNTVVFGPINGYFSIGMRI